LLHCSRQENFKSLEDSCYQRLFWAGSNLPEEASGKRPGL
jgi:hypothetical protein